MAKKISPLNIHGIELAEHILKDDLNMEYRLIPHVSENILPDPLRSQDYHAKALIFVKPEMLKKAKTIHKKFVKLLTEPFEKRQIAIPPMSIQASQYFFESKDNDIKELVVIFIVNEAKDFDDVAGSFEVDKFDIREIYDPNRVSKGWTLGVGA